MSVNPTFVDVDESLTSVSLIIDNGDFGKRVVKFETGRLALKASGAVVAYLDDETMILATTTHSKNPKEDFDFFPLTVDVEERMYAAGKIPGSFFRREGRPPTEAILASRLIDRPLRPIFTEGLRHEVQIIVTVLSINPNDYYDVLAINGASAATHISDLPFAGPVGGVRIALIPTESNKTGQWVAFPTVEQLAISVFNMVVAGRIVTDPTTGTSDVAVIMVEAEAAEKVIDLVADGAAAPDEKIVAQGLEAAKVFISQLCKAQIELAEKAGKPTLDFPIFSDYQDDVLQAVTEIVKNDIVSALAITNKIERDDKIDELKLRLLDALSEKFVSRENEITAAFRSVMKQEIRKKILAEHFRIDGREVTDIRALSAEISVIPRAHGSAIFERGETQILGVTTLDMMSKSQQLDSLAPETSKRYMHHYNFPPYSTGETGRVGALKRREIGHGALAERALIPVIPAVEDFPYAIRQVSEALGSNGSTSMGSVCASTLSLLSAGVPLRAPVAGIAMGLVSGVNEKGTGLEYIALTDILGEEDAFGDMDFKVAGTKDFITALQLDTKLDGIPSEVLTRALEQARQARLTILDVMAAAISIPNSLNQYAPRIKTVKIPPEKIGELIGPKGKTINNISETTGVTINIEDDGTVFIGATSDESAAAAITQVNNIANPRIPKVGEHFEGTVVKTTTFGAFISLLPGSDGLVHISKLGKGKRVAKVEDVLKTGDIVKVVVDEIDDKGKISLSLNLT